MNVRKIFNSLAFRLFSLILLISAVVFISLTSLIIRANRQHVMQQIILSARRTDALLVRSMRQSMLHNHLEEVAQTIDSLGGEPGVENIRIYDTKGSLVFSSFPKEIGQKVDLRAEQCIVCHSGEKPLENIPETVRSRIFASPDGYRVLGMLRSIRNEPACAAPDCHPPPSQRKILGVLESQFSLSQVDKDIAASRNLMILYSIGAVLTMELFAGLFLRRIVHSRMVKLAEGPRQFEKGNLDFNVPVEGKDEIADLARSFNSMIASLKRAEAETELSRKMVEIAKMDSMGKLAAFVAHEINNPLGGVLAYNRLISRKIGSGPITEIEKEEVLGHLEAAIGEIKRCGNIVKNLLLFSSSLESAKEKVDIHNLIEKSLSSTNHYFQMNDISTATRLEAKDPSIVGNANQIVQVLIALFMNAAEAMQQGGALTVATEDVAEPDAIRVIVADDGEGIPQEIQSSIFEPFFTTKKDGHSIGLGLSVVYGIMLRHQGKIEVESEPGRGTTFILIFPRVIKPQEDKEPIFEQPVVTQL
jgi:two-component system, NtrC family, sensor kinase